MLLSEMMKVPCALISSPDSPNTIFMKMHSAIIFNTSSFAFFSSHVCIFAVSFAFPQSSFMFLFANVSDCENHNVMMSELFTEIHAISSEESFNERKKSCEIMRNYPYSRWCLVHSASDNTLHILIDCIINATDLPQQRRCRRCCYKSRVTLIIFQSFTRSLSHRVWEIRVSLLTRLSSLIVSTLLAL